MKNLYLFVIIILLSLFFVFALIHFFNIYFIYACLIFAAALAIAYIVLIKIFYQFSLRNRLLSSQTSTGSGNKQNITNVTLYLEKLKNTDHKLKEHLIPAHDKIYKIKSLMEQSMAALSTYETSFQSQDQTSAGKTIPVTTSWTDEKESTPKSSDQYYTKLKEDLNLIKENTSKVYEISDNITKSAETAMELSKNVKEGIITVTKSLTESLIHSEKLFVQSKKIGEILELISDIASKTNVLSINASIVSARVGGKDGQTFGVVAREIRNLAAETEKSLSQIESVTKEVQQLIGILAEKIKVSESQTRQEMDTILQVAGSLQGIVLGVEVVRSVSITIKEKSNFHNEALNSTVQITQQNMATTINDKSQNKAVFDNYLKNQIASLQDAIYLLEE